jgi:hypothetical protein
MSVFRRATLGLTTAGLVALGTTGALGKPLPQYDADPTCADITYGNYAYTLTRDAGGTVLGGAVTLDEGMGDFGDTPTCHDVKYTFRVVDENGKVLGVQSQHGAGTSTVSFFVPCPCARTAATRPRCASPGRRCTRTRSSTPPPTTAAS